MGRHSRQDEGQSIALSGARRWWDPFTPRKVWEEEWGVGFLQKSLSLEGAMCSSFGSTLRKHILIPHCCSKNN